MQQEPRELGDVREDCVTACVRVCNEIRRGRSTLQVLLSGPSSARPQMSTASAAEPAQQRGAETPAESAGCWWKAHLVQACRSLVALKSAAEDGRVSDQINRAIGRLNFLVRHASNFDGQRQLPRFLGL